MQADTRSFRERNYIQFGIFTLHETMLNNKNKLLVKYDKSFAPVPSIKQTTVSDTFKYLIIDLLDTQKINIDLQKQLSNNEMDLFENLLKKSKTIGLLNYKRIKQNNETLIKNYKIRLTILQGSFNAGNINEEIINEALELINKLYELNELSTADFNMLNNVFI